MRILVISRSAWRNDNSTGNTLTDFFSEMPDAEIFSLCMREQPPQNNIAKRNFFISEKQMIRKILGKSATVGAENSPETADDGSEKAMYDKAKKRTHYWMYAVREIVWDLGGWKNEALKAYIEDIRPDIIFFPTFGHYYPHKLLRHLHTLTDAKIVLFHADDHYTLKQWSFSPIYWLYRFGLRKWMRRTAKIASLQYCISDVQKEDYDKAFGCECKVLTKFADFSGEAPLKGTYGDPLQFVFTGNINLNRWKSLAMLANALKRLNQDGVKAQLRIYTATPMTEAMQKALDVPETSFLMGSVPSTEIPRIQSEADCLVHAESTDRKNRLTVRQSFSTKIVDYLKAARPIVAVGPKEVASIKHLRDHICAVIADSEEELFNKLSGMFEFPSVMNELARNAYACGKACHNKEDMLAMLRQDFENLTK